jgi:hypothetical protein
MVRDLSKEKVGKDKRTGLAGWTKRMNKTESEVREVQKKKAHTPVGHQDVVINTD